MGQIEKTVFISYRRTNLPWALNIYQNLTAHGYDVFFDYESIPSGDFEQIILENIRSRAHFLVILTPSMLERIDEPNDWVRFEIETALEEKRNIVSLFFEGFNFSDSYVSDKLTGKLALLRKYAGFDVPASYFGEAMDRLRNRYLNVSLEVVKHPVSVVAQKEVQKQQIAANIAVTNENDLKAQELFEQAHKHWLDKNHDKAIQYATEAILLKPDFAEAYMRRGAARSGRGDSNGAIQDYNEAILLKPDYAAAYYNRGIVRSKKGDLDGAIQDYNETIRLKPDDANAYINRGNVRSDKGDLDGAIKDYNEAIRLRPDYGEAYINRGNAHYKKSDLDRALKDYNEAVRLKPSYALAYRNRGVVWNKKGNYSAALADFEKSVQLGDEEPNIPKRILELRELISK